MMNGYSSDQGYLVRTPLMIVDGDLYIVGHTYPERLTFDRTTELKGWGRDDGTADVYLRDGGRELIIPERFALRVRDVANPKGGAE